MSTNKNVITCDQNTEFLAYNHFEGCMEGLVVSLWHESDAPSLIMNYHYELSLIMN